MKAVQFAEYGGPEVLHVVEADEPHAGPGEVRIAVRAAAVNPPDWKIRSGVRREFCPRDLPSAVGFEAAGVVDEIGDDVTDVSVGDAVFGFGEPTYAEYAVLDAWARKPEAMSFAEAGAISIAGETALRILDAIGLKAGQTLLVVGAAGGVGSVIVQLARRRGATVIGTDSAVNQDYIRSLGALATTSEPGWVDRLRSLAPDGIDLALDTVAGADVVDDLIELTGDRQKVGSLMLSTQDKGIVTSFTRAEDLRPALAEVAVAYQDGFARVRIDRTFTLAESGEAHRIGASGGARGKLVIVPS